MTCQASRFHVVLATICIASTFAATPVTAQGDCCAATQEHVVVASDICATTCQPSIETNCDSWSQAGMPSMSFELNTIMTAQIQSLTAEVESLRTDAEQTATLQQEMTDELAALQAERDQLLAEITSLTESLQVTKQTAAADIAAAEEKTKKSQTALAQAKKQNQNLQRKLAAANEKSKQANQELVAIAKEQKNDKPKRNTDDQPVERQANRDDEAETVESTGEAKQGKQGKGDPKPTSDSGDEA